MDSRAGAEAAAGGRGRLHQDYVAGENRWIGRLEEVAGRVTSQLATMGMPHVRYAPERSGTVNTKLTLFFEGVLGALAYLHSNPVLRGRPRSLGLSSLQQDGHASRGGPATLPEGHD